MPIFISERERQVADPFLIFRLWYGDALSIAVIVASLVTRNFPLWLCLFGIVWYAVCIAEWLRGRYP